MTHRESRFSPEHAPRRLIAAIGFLTLAALLALVARPLVFEGRAAPERQAQSQCFTVSADAYVTSEQSGTNFGSATQLLVRELEVDEFWSYAQFDLSSIPADATVTSATLELYLDSAESADVQTTIHAAADAWGESTITWDNQPGGTGTTYADVVHESTAGWKTWDVTNLVQEWVGGGLTNHGAIVKPDAFGTRATFVASEADLTAPQLCVEWEEPTATPTPTPTPEAFFCETNGATPQQFLAVGDATIRQDQPGTNFGDARRLDVARETVSTKQRYTFLEFDLSSIPDDAIVRSAELAMYLEEGGPGTEVYTELDRIEESWGESTITWDNQPLPEGFTEGPFSHATSRGWKTWSVEYWVYERLDTRNSTLRITPSELESLFLSFASREQGDKLAPRLCIDWVRPTPTPSPTPTPTPTPLADLSVDDMEVSQGIQNLDHDVPLVARRETFVRVFPQALRGGSRVSQAGVDAVLHGTEGGSALPNSPLNPVSGTVDIPVAWDRAEEDHSFIFRLPPSWDAQGTIDLEAEINPDGTIPETSSANNTLSQTVGFEEEKEDICLVLYPVDTQRKGVPTLNERAVRRMVERTESTLPVPTIRHFIRDSGPPVRERSWGPSPFEGNDGGKIVYQMWRMGPARPGSRPSECLQEGLRTHYAGVVPKGGMPRVGRAYTPGRALWFMKDLDKGNVIRGDYPNDPEGGLWLAHELGHNFGRAHVNCPAGSPDDPDQNYPYFRCNIGPVPSDSTEQVEYFGFDGVNRAVIGPTDVGDIMSYANRGTWSSDYTWKGVLGSLQAASEETGIQPTTDRAEGGDGQASSDELLVGALIESGSLTRVVWERLPAGHLPAETVREMRAAQSGEYEVQLLDGAGGLLASQGIGVDSVSGPGDGNALLNTVMPFEAGTEEIRILRAGSVLTSTAVSTHAPTVQVDSPNGGESIGDQLTVTWSAADSDGDDLLHSVEYSPDGGETWLLLADRISSTRVTVDTESLPGSDGGSLVRVLTTDGVNVAMDESDAPFSLPRKGPEARITGPEAVFFSAEQAIYLDGVGTDPEDGYLQGEELRWFVEGRGQIGTGGTAYLASLETGCHRIRFEAIDSDGQTDSDETMVCAGVAPQRIYVPLVLRNLQP